MATFDEHLARIRRGSPSIGTSSLLGREDPLAKLQGRLTGLQELAAKAGVREPKRQSSPLEKIVDVLLRPNYAAAGFFDDFLNEGGTIGSAMGRAGTELFSGIGGLRGQKETFGNVLEDMGLPTGPRVSDAFPWLYNASGKGWKLRRKGVADPNARGAAGFGLDVGLDPLTYFGAGTGRAAAKLLLNEATRKSIAKGVSNKALREMVEKGKIPLTRPGNKEWKKALKRNEHLIPETQLKNINYLIDKVASGPEAELLRKGVAEKVGQKGLGLFDIGDVAKDVLERGGKAYDANDVLQNMHEIFDGANRAAAEAATKEIVAMADAGFSRLVHPGGLRWAGMTLIPGERFKPIGTAATRLFRHMETRGGLAGEIIRGVKQVDAAFNETVRGARKIPGVLATIGRYRGERRRMLTDVRRTVEMLVPKGWAKAKAVDGTSLYEAIFRHLDNPAKYSKDNIPQAMHSGVEHIRVALEGVQAKEVRMGLMDKSSAVQHYITHSFDNTKEELGRLATRYKSKMGLGDEVNDIVTNWREVRRFQTIDEVVEFGREMGVELKPVYDLRELLQRRLSGHAEAVSFRNHEIRMLSTYGVHPNLVATETFKHAFPELHRIVNQLIDEAQDKMPKTMVRRAKPQNKPGMQTKMFGKKMEVDEEFGAEFAARQAAERAGTAPPHAIHEAPKQLDMFGNFNEETVIKVGDFLNRHVGKGIGAGGEKLSLKGFTPQEKGLILLGWIRQAESPEEIFRLLKAKKLISEAAPGAPEAITRALRIKRADTLGTFNEPMKQLTSTPDARGYRAIKPGMEEFEGIWMPEAIVDSFSRLNAEIVNEKEVKGLLKVYDWFLDVFRGAVTAPWLGFHARNHFSNVLQNFVEIGFNALNPQKAMQALRVMTGADDTVVSIAGKKMTFGEVRTWMRELGVWQDRASIFEKATTTGRRDFIKDNLLFRGGQAVGGGIENHARVMLFLSGVERGLDPMEAVLRVHQTLFDYEAMSPIHKQILRRVVPFPTWMTRNVGLQARKLLTEPGRVAVGIKPGDWGNKGPEEDMLPEYLRGRFRIKVGTKGDHAFLTNIDMPFASAIESVFGIIPEKGKSGAVARGDELIKSHIQNLAPFLKTIIERAMGQEFFTGQSLDEREMLRGLGPLFRDMPKPVKEFFEYNESIDSRGEKQYSVNRTKVHLLFKSWALARVYSTGRRLDPKAKGLKDGLLESFWVTMLTGTKLEEFDLTRAQENILRARIKRLEADLKRRGKLRAFEVTYQPKGR